MHASVCPYKYRSRVYRHTPIERCMAHIHEHAQLQLSQTETALAPRRSGKDLKCCLCVKADLRACMCLLLGPLFCSVHTCPFLRRYHAILITALSYVSVHGKKIPFLFTLFLKFHCPSWIFSCLCEVENRIPISFCWNCCWNYIGFRDEPGRKSMAFW